MRKRFEKREIHNWGPRVLIFLTSIWTTMYVVSSSHLDSHSRGKPPKPPDKRATSLNDRFVSHLSFSQLPQWTSQSVSCRAVDMDWPSAMQTRERIEPGSQWVASRLLLFLFGFLEYVKNTASTRENAYRSRFEDSRRQVALISS